jgi:hypothetical protein
MCVSKYLNNVKRVKITGMCAEINEVHVEEWCYNSLAFCLSHFTMCKIIERKRNPLRTQKWQNWKCCRLGFIEPVHGCTGKYKLPTTPPSTGLSRIQYLDMTNGKFLNRCVHTAVIKEPSMWRFCAIPWKAALVCLL